ncbi:hypothetical protein HWX16_20775 [Ochrobactrum intermedium]|uniref:hypothetical protein n=1 Tax=Brucella intermedia TaxID=94625 RepID=UPI00159C4938|nr:hypothetical protein [Brucella intermedia]NVM42751.1 hypothetical protein [Brucella intermedia]
MNSNVANFAQSECWMTAGQLAKFKIVGLPTSESGVIRYLKRLPSIPSIFLRKRSAVGGGFEYHYFALPLESIVDFESRFSPPRPALDALALRDGGSFVESAEGGKLFAFIRREHVIDPGASAATIRRRSIEQFGNYVLAVEIETGLLKRTFMPTLTAFRRVLSDVRAYYALGVTTRRVGFDRVFDRFARSRLCTAIGDDAVIQLEEQIRGMMDRVSKV